MWDLIWKVPSPGIEPGSALHCERGVLATGPPGKPREPAFMTHTHGSAWQHREGTAVLRLLRWCVSSALPVAEQACGRRLPSDRMSPQAVL